MIGHGKDLGAMTCTLGSYDTIVTGAENFCDSVIAVCVNILSRRYDQMMVYWKDEGLGTWIIQGIESTTRGLLALLARR